MADHYGNLRVEVDGKTAIVTIDRPQRKNAIDIVTMKELDTALDRIASDEGILALILSGGGEEAFIAGGDLKYFQTLDTLHKGREMSILCSNLLDRLEGLDIPVIAAIDGYAFGGGCEFALACDVRIASKKAIFGFRQINMGIMTSWGGGKRLVRIVGKSKALLLLLTGDTLSATEALELGLVDKVVEQGQALTEAKDLARRITNNAPLGVRFIKRFLNSCVEMSARDANLLETEMFSILWDSEDHYEAVEAFFGKRSPVFKGR
jgi:enoyl-CoA hydratase